MQDGTFSGVVQYVPFNYWLRYIAENYDIAVNNLDVYAKTHQVVSKNSKFTSGTCKISNHDYDLLCAFYVG